jgi:hypothetical protein
VVFAVEFNRKIHAPQYSPRGSIPPGKLKTLNR